MRWRSFSRRRLRYALPWLALEESPVGQVDWTSLVAFTSRCLISFSQVQFILVYFVAIFPCRFRFFQTIGRKVATFQGVIHMVFVALSRFISWSLTLSYLKFMIYKSFQSNFVLSKGQSGTHNHTENKVCQSNLPVRSKDWCFWICTMFCDQNFRRSCNVMFE